MGTIPEPKTAVFARTMENQNRDIFGANQTVLTKAISGS